jgi:hypothetical protein
MITRDSIKEFTLEQCQAYEQQLQQQYDFDQSITQCYTEEIDHVINCVLWLEDRRQALTYQDMSRRALAARYNADGSPDPRGRHIATPRGIADSVAHAAELTGYAQKTIQTYLVTRPQEYYRITVKDIDTQS